MSIFHFYDISLGFVLAFAWAFFSYWWWVAVPAILYPGAKFFHLWWIQWEVFYNEQEWILLEIIPPSEILKPFQAMEDVINALWPVYDGPCWREFWCEGEKDNGPFWFSFEVVSIGGQVHFYVRILKDQKDFFESIFHTHYPDLEFFPAEDYTQKIPQDIPNDKYDLYGEHIGTIKPDAYPIKTYKSFEISPGESDQEKMLDPFSNLMESMAKLKEGEQLWLQIILNPITNDDVPWVDAAKKEADKIARRPADPDRKSMVGEMFRLMAHNKDPYSEEEKEKDLIPPEMKLTPGEREKLLTVEEKMDQPAFRTHIRAVYVAEKDAFVSANKRIPRGYVAHFSSGGNFMKDNGFKTKIHYFFRQRRLYLRKRRMLQLAVKRFPPNFPEVGGKGTMILISEEIATFFHFPSKASALPSGVPRIMAKKATPPPNLPTE